MKFPFYMFFNCPCNIQLQYKEWWSYQWMTRQSSYLWGALFIQGYPDPVESYTVVYGQQSQHRRRQIRQMCVAFSSTAMFSMITSLDPGITYQFQVFATVLEKNTAIVGERSSAGQNRDKDEFCMFYVKLFSLDCFQALLLLHTMIKVTQNWAHARRKKIYHLGAYILMMVHVGGALDIHDM